MITNPNKVTHKIEIILFTFVTFVVQCWVSTPPPQIPQTMFFWPLNFQAHHLKDFAYLRVEPQLTDAAGDMLPLGGGGGEAQRVMEDGLLHRVYLQGGVRKGWGGAIIISCFAYTQDETDSSCLWRWKEIMWPDEISVNRNHLFQSYCQWAEIEE